LKLCPMDSFVLWKRPRIRTTHALTVDSVNGVLICDVAAVLAKIATAERATKEPNQKGKMNPGSIPQR